MFDAVHGGASPVRRPEEIEGIVLMIKMNIDIDTQYAFTWEFRPPP